jgi:hypothetical protein
MITQMAVPMEPANPKVQGCVDYWYYQQADRYKIQSFPIGEEAGALKRRMEKSDKNSYYLNRPEVPASKGRVVSADTPDYLSKNLFHF